MAKEDIPDLIGKKIGYLTIESIADVKYRGELQYVCKCECGKTIFVRRCNLRSGNTKSCGCKRAKMMLESRRKKHPPKDLTGEQFGKLTVISKSKRRQHTNAIWICKCSCGKITEVNQENLLYGHTKSCGCLSRETASKNNRTHSESHSRLYRVWRSMKTRCQNPSSDGYKNYGGRGISVCEQWQKYEPFRDWAMSHGYDPQAPFGKCTIDRIDNDGNYEPSNCRWVDMKTQASNKKRKEMVER